MFSKCASVFFGLALLVGAGAARADDSSSQDKQFVTKAASAGMEEVKLGQYAADHSTNDDVKNFGRKMVEDHTKANDKLKSICSAKGIDVPSDMSDDDKAVMEKMEKLSGSEFDKAYATQMVKDHRNAIDLFTKEKDAGGDGQVKDFAGETLPTLRHHLQMAQDMDGKLNG